MASPRRSRFSARGRRSAWSRRSVTTTPGAGVRTGWRRTGSRPGSRSSPTSRPGTSSSCPTAARATRTPPHSSSRVPTPHSTAAPSSMTRSPTTSSWSSSTCRRRWWRRSCARPTAGRHGSSSTPARSPPSTPQAAALADPFVVGERDAALLADVGLIPGSLCVTFGRAGAVWNGLRIDSENLGSPRHGARRDRGLLRRARRRPGRRSRPGVGAASRSRRRRRAGSSGFVDTSRQAGSTTKA